MYYQVLACRYCQSGGWGHYTGGGSLLSSTLTRYVRCHGTSGSGGLSGGHSAYLHGAHPQN